MEASTIIYIHEYLTDYFRDSDDPVDPPGVKEQTTIESAAARPYITAGGREAYSTVFEKSAALFHSVISNHSFHNGNKRTALLSTMYFLGEHGYWLDRCDDEEMYEFTRKAAAHELCDDRNNEVREISEWLQHNSRKRQKGEKQLKLHELREILSNFGYSLSDNGKTLDVIADGDKIETILKKGAQGFEDYDPAYISELRKRLSLVPSEGIDSARFYGQKGISDDLSEFMELRVNVMKWLAKI